jgi:hypothetical protein
MDRRDKARRANSNGEPLAPEAFGCLLCRMSGDEHGL